MKIIYIAGPFRAPTNYQIKLNVRRAEAAGLEVCKLGAMALIPHKNTEEFQGELPDEFWLDGTLALLRRSDALLAIEGWERSSGSRGEIAEANRLHIPVFYAIEEVRAWLGRVDPPETSSEGTHVAPVNTFSTPGGVQPPHWRGVGPNRRPDTKPCDRCKGEGKCGPWGDSDRDVTDIQTCPKCRGAKVVPMQESA